MENLISNIELAKLLNVSTKTIQRSVSDGLPIAKEEPSKTGGRAKKMFDPEVAKHWFIDNKPGKPVAKFIEKNCPPKELRKKNADRDKQVKKKAKAEKAKAEQIANDLERRLNDKTLSGDDLYCMAKRLCEAEKRAFQAYESYLFSREKIGDAFSVSTAEVLERSYTRIAARRQSFEEKLPKIMGDKGVWVNSDKVIQIVTRSWLTLCSKLDLQGSALADKVFGKDVQTIKSIIDSSNSEMRRSLQDEIKSYLHE